MPRTVLLFGVACACLGFFEIRMHGERSPSKWKIRAELKNATDQSVEGVLKGKIEDIEFSQLVKLEAHQTQVVRFTPENFAQLKIANPRLCRPYSPGHANRISSGFRSGIGA